MVVIKVGGNELDGASFTDRLAEAIATLGEPVIVVHGGGKAIGDMQARLGLLARKVDGLRVTDGPSLEVALMVLSGSVNKRIVQALLMRGVQAIGISGVDGGLLRCKKKSDLGHNLGLVGEISAVNRRILSLLVEAGFTSVVSPISLGVDGLIYNVNADEAAGAIAAALGVRQLWFISNVAGVFDHNGHPISTLTATEASMLIASKTIRDGMIPKVRAALDVVKTGVPEVIISNLDGLTRGTGTRFILSQEGLKDSRRNWQNSTNE